MARALIVLPKANRPGRRDFSGAFLPESRKFRAWWELAGGAVDECRIGANEGIATVLALLAQSAQLTTAPEHAQPVTRVAFFCHGGPRQLYLGGLRVATAPDSPFQQLCAGLARHAAPGLCVTLFACSAGGGPGPGGDGGFADSLRDRVLELGLAARVDAHDRAGHTTLNPYVRRFESELGNVGGQWIVRPGSPLFPAWRRALRGDLRWRFSAMEVSELHDSLIGPPP